MPSMPEGRRQDRELRRLIADGVFATEDKQGQINILRQWKREGNVPANFETPEQLIDQVAAVIASGKSKAEALQELQVFLPRTFFDKSGNINKRVVRNAPGKSLSDAWDLVNSGLSASQLDKIQKADWKDLQEQYREIGRRLGFNLDIGHFKTSAAGAPQDVSAGSAEYNLANQAAGRTENAFRPMSTSEMDNVGASSNKVEGMSEAALRATGLPTRGGSNGSPLNPYIGVLLGTEYKGISSRLLSTKNLEQLNRAFEDLVRQGSNPVAMYDYIRERAGEGITVDGLAKAGLEQYDLSKFHPSSVSESQIRTSYLPGRVPEIQNNFKVANGLAAPNVTTSVGQRPTTATESVKRPNGSRAILNGKQVVWSGDRWVLAPTAVVNRPRQQVTNQRQVAKPQKPNSATPKPTLNIPKPSTRPTNRGQSTRPRGTAGVQLLINEAPSLERYGPGGLIGTVDQIHERQFTTNPRNW